MPHDIDDVWALCKDIQNTLNDLHPIKEKVDTILTEVTTDVIWQVCGVCKGLGTVPRDVFVGTEHTTVQDTCQQCLGAKRVKFGEQQPTIPMPT